MSLTILQLVAARAKQLQLAGAFICLYDLSDSVEYILLKK